jgi:hypothetical protein
VRRLAAALLLALSCPRIEGDLLYVPDAGTCSTVSCGGCCDPTGRCQPGVSDLACGASGAACASCGATAECVGGACLALDAGACTACLTSNDCAGGACVQFATDSICADKCEADGGCDDPGELCVHATAFDGQDIETCLPASGTCGPVEGCGTCAAGTSCDYLTGSCVAVPPDAGVPTPDGGRCGSLVSPSTAACCHSCTVGVGDCQANGCYGGWWCDAANQPSCWCRRPPTTCDYDAGVIDAGPVEGSVGREGGAVSRLYFAVVGDTRPANLDDTAGYPSAVISKIYADIEALSPRPQFVIATGDYLFATPSGTQGSAQLTKYVGATRQFTGPVFAAMGNCECTGYTSSNCAGAASNNNYAAFLSSLVTPLGKSEPYYVFRVSALDGSWSAKFVVLACNAWDAAQRAWFQTQMSSPTTYTFVVRHEPSGSSSAPCILESNQTLQQYPYEMLIVGHSHAYSANPGTRQLLVGNGGAPSSATFGFAVVEQVATGFRVTGYDWATSAPVSSALFLP